MSIVVLTGPAASGKNTVSKIIAHKRHGCAIIDVDSVRQMYLQPHKAPWEGEEGRKQQILGVENACLLANNFSKDNIDVIILDVLTNETANLYKKNLPKITIVLLLPSLEETRKRFKARPHTITDQEFELIYKWEEELSVYDKKIDNTGLTAEETANEINNLLI